MNYVIRAIIFILVVAALAACQAGGGPLETESPNVLPATEAVLPAYPAYPVIADPTATAVDTGSGGSGIYPFLVDGDMVTWDQAVALIQNLEVAQVVQAHDLTVVITTVDGRTLTTSEPQIDAIFEVIKACGDPCKDIAIATE